MPSLSHSSMLVSYLLLLSPLMVRSAWESAGGLVPERTVHRNRTLTMTRTLARKDDDHEDDHDDYDDDDDHDDLSPSQHHVFSHGTSSSVNPLAASKFSQPTPHLGEYVLMEDILQGEEIQLEVNTPLGLIDTSPTWRLSFEIRLDSVISGWGNILHITGNGDNIDNYSRIPGVWTDRSTNTLHVRTGTSTSRNAGCGSTGTLNIGEYNKVVIEVTASNTMVVTINGDEKCNVRMPGELLEPRFGAQIYVSDPWYSASDAAVRNLKYEWTTNCAKGWTPVTDRCVRKTPNPRSYTGCQEFCRETSPVDDAVGTLACINSPHENAKIWAMATEGQISGIQEHYGFHIGLNDLDTDNDFMWDSSCDSEYRNWAETVTNVKGASECVAVDAENDGFWSKLLCDDQAQYQCMCQAPSMGEITLGPTSAPSTSPTTASPATLAPATESPLTVAPVYSPTSAPITESPASEAPTSQAPSMSPATSAPLELGITSLPTTAMPSLAPTSSPVALGFTSAPTEADTAAPTPRVTAEPTAAPTLGGTAEPTAAPLLNGNGPFDDVPTVTVAATWENIDFASFEPNIESFTNDFNTAVASVLQTDVNNIQTSLAAGSLVARSTIPVENDDEGNLLTDELTKNSDTIFSEDNGFASQQWGKPSSVSASYANEEKSADEEVTEENGGGSSEELNIAMIVPAVIAGVVFLVVAGVGSYYIFCRGKVCGKDKDPKAESKVETVPRRYRPEICDAKGGSRARSRSKSHHSRMSKSQLSAVVISRPGSRHGSRAEPLPRRKSSRRKARSYVDGDRPDVVSRSKSRNGRSSSRGRVLRAGSSASAFSGKPRVVRSSKSRLRMGIYDDDSDDNRSDISSKTVALGGRPRVSSRKKLSRRGSIKNHLERSGISTHHSDGMVAAAGSRSVGGGRPRISRIELKDLLRPVGAASSSSISKSKHEKKRGSESSAAGALMGGSDMALTRQGSLGSMSLKSLSSADLNAAAPGYSAIPRRGSITSVGSNTPSEDLVLRPRGILKKSSSSSRRGSLSFSERRRPKIEKVGVAGSNDFDRAPPPPPYEKPRPRSILKKSSKSSSRRSTSFTERRRPRVDRVLRPRKASDKRLPRPIIEEDIPPPPPPLPPRPKSMSYGRPVVERVNDKKKKPSSRKSGAVPPPPPPLPARPKKQNQSMSYIEPSRPRSSRTKAVAGERRKARVPREVRRRNRKSEAEEKFDRYLAKMNKRASGSSRSSRIGRSPAPPPPPPARSSSRSELGPPRVVSSKRKKKRVPPGPPGGPPPAGAPPGGPGFDTFGLSEITEEKKKGNVAAFSTDDIPAGAVPAKKSGSSVQSNCQTLPTAPFPFPSDFHTIPENA